MDLFASVPSYVTVLPSERVTPVSPLESDELLNISLSNSRSVVTISIFRRLIGRAYQIRLPLCQRRSRIPKNRRLVLRHLPIYRLLKIRPNQAAPCFRNCGLIPAGPAWRVFENRLPSWTGYAPSAC